MIFRIFMILISLIIALETIGEVKARDLPFGGSVGMSGIKDKEEKIIAGKLFGFTFCLQTFDTTLTGIEMNVSVPPEVEHTEGETSWHGKLGPRQERCLFITMKSRTDMDNWSQPIHGHAAFAETGDGLTYTRDVKWSYKNFDDTGFVPITK